MADFGVYTKSADIAALVGINAGTTAKAVETTDVYVLNVEAGIDLETNEDWSTLFAAGSLDSSKKLILTQTGAAGCAMVVINADPTGYSARERESSMDFLNSLYQNGIRILKVDDATAMVIT